MSDPRMLKSTSHLRFKGKDIRHFLDLYQLEADQRKVTSKDRVLDIICYVKTKFIDRIKKTEAHKAASLGQDRDAADNDVWKSLKQSMLTTFMDEDFTKYTVNDLERFVKKTRVQGPPKAMVPLSKYYYKFTEISSYLRDKDILGHHEETRLFLEGLHSTLRDVIIDPNSVKSLIASSTKNGVRKVSEILEDLRPKAMIGHVIHTAPCYIA